MKILPAHLKIIAVILLCLAASFAARNFIAYEQNLYVLESPLIPKSMMKKLANPFLYLAIGGTMACGIAWFCYWKNRYILSGIISAATLLAQLIIFTFGIHAFIY